MHEYVTKPICIWEYTYNVDFSFQCEGKGYNDKSDIWALGCILYEMACLERTFEGTNLPAVIHKIVQVSFTPVKGDYTEGFKELVSEEPLCAFMRMLKG